MWKPDHRRAAYRRGLRYPSDLTDAEWALVSPLIALAKRGGRPHTVDVREVLNAIFYVLSKFSRSPFLLPDLRQTMPLLIPSSHSKAFPVVNSRGILALARTWCSRR